MKREVEKMAIEDLLTRAPSINFPEYQRESTVWNRRSQQRLIDSIIRGFDISAFYFYRTELGELECIDGRQRITAILSFTGDYSDDENTTYQMLFENEIAPEDDSKFAHLNGLKYSDLKQKSVSSESHRAALNQFLQYEIIAVMLSESEEQSEFNLQFARLNLGAILNSGEKLHAMKGDMRDFCFEDIGKHPFLENTKIPERRFAREQVAAQFLSEIFSLEDNKEFRRIRHFDLQKFFKQKFHMDSSDSVVCDKAKNLLSNLQAAFKEDASLLSNRALTVSLVILAWTNEKHIPTLPAFWTHFSDRLSSQIERIKELKAPETQYQWLIEFQKDVTQASVEKPAVTRRHETLNKEFALFRDQKRITGDS